MTLDFLHLLPATSLFFFLGKLSVRLEGGNYTMKQAPVNEVLFFFNRRTVKLSRDLRLKSSLRGQ